MIKQTIKNGLRSYMRRNSRKIYDDFYNKIIADHPGMGMDKPAEGEHEWLHRWRDIDPDVSVKAYRIFSKYVSKEKRLDIVPLSTSNNYIENVLNPYEFAYYYGDKNMLDKVFGIEKTCGSILRRINGCYYTPDYVPFDIDDNVLSDMLSDEGKILIKPSRDSYGGHGIRVLTNINRGGVCRQ